MKENYISAAGPTRVKISDRYTQFVWPPTILLGVVGLLNFHIRELIYLAGGEFTLGSPFQQIIGGCLLIIGGSGLADRSWRPLTPRRAAYAPLLIAGLAFVTLLPSEGRTMYRVLGGSVGAALTSTLFRDPAVYVIATSGLIIGSAGNQRRLRPIVLVLVVSGALSALNLEQAPVEVSVLAALYGLPALALGYIATARRETGDNISQNT